MPDYALVDALSAAVPALHAWYVRVARDLPWRRTRDPYAIWISEVMLQQTRVEAVRPYYARWMATFPTVAALAEAPEADVLRVWEGLGYYSRARNLHRAAQAVVAQYRGHIPSDPVLFRALPGVGAYTSAAVGSIAFGHDLAVVDGNVRRVLARLAAIPDDVRRPAVDRRLATLATALLPAGTAALHNQAMMELGALVCTPRTPDCAACPVASACVARREGAPERYPVRPPKREVPHRDVAIAVVRNERGQLLLDQRPYDGMLAGLWEFPGGKLEAGETAVEALVRELREEFGMEVEVGAPLAPVDHAYSHLRVTLHPFECRYVAMEPAAGEGRPWTWVLPAALGDYAMPRANRRIVEQILADTVPPPSARARRRRRAGDAEAVS